MKTVESTFESLDLSGTGEGMDLELEVELSVTDADAGQLRWFVLGLWSPSLDRTVSMKELSIRDLNRLHIHCDNLLTCYEDQVWELWREVIEAWPTPDGDK